MKLLHNRMLNADKASRDAYHRAHKVLSAAVEDLFAEYTLGAIELSRNSMTDEVMLRLQLMPRLPGGSPKDPSL